MTLRLGVAAAVLLIGLALIAAYRARVREVPTRSPGISVVPGPAVREPGPVRATPVTFGPVTEETLRRRVSDRLERQFGLREPVTAECSVESCRVQISFTPGSEPPRRTVDALTGGGFERLALELGLFPTGAAEVNVNGQNSIAIIQTVARRGSGA